jgi:hypothetical protein
VRVTAAIESRLGTTMPVVDYALDRLFGGLTVAALTAAIDGELGAVAALDGFIARDGRPDAWARGVERVTVVASDTTIGTAIPPLAFALCAKCRVIVQDRTDALVAAFAETLGEALPALRDAIEVQAWNEAGSTDADLGRAEVIIAFGDLATLRALRTACAPDATFVAFGRRASASYVARVELDGDLATLSAGIARDALVGAGDGSPHVLFLEDADRDARGRFVRALTDACEAAAIEFPPGAARIVLDAPGDVAPPFGAGTLPVVIVGGPDDAGAYVRRHALALHAITTSAATGDDAAAELAVCLGAVRVAPFGALHAPPIAGHGGGRARIADFVRWIDRE